MSDAPPKSAVELAMEKLKRQDAETGVEARVLSDDQKAAIADARRDYEAKVAECRILSDASRATAVDPEALRELEENYQRDLSRIASARDKKIREITESRAD